MGYHPPYNDTIECSVVDTYVCVCVYIYMCLAVCACQHCQLVAILYHHAIWPGTHFDLMPISELADFISFLSARI